MRPKRIFILFGIFLITAMCMCINSLLADQKKVIILINKDADYRGNWEEDARSQGSGGLVVDPSNLDLTDSAPIGKVAYGTVTVTNNGGNGVNISSVNLEGDTVFAIESNSCDGTLNGGESCIIKVKFTPADDQVHNAVLKITANTGTLNVDVTGKASDEYFCGGSGTEQDPYLICNAYQLQNFGEWLKTHGRIGDAGGGAGYYFALAKDIDLSVLGNFTPIGYSYNVEFAGTFDGRGHVIRNLSVNCRGYCGLFSTLYRATVKNLILENPHVHSSRDSNGSLAGSAIGSIITNCGSIGGIVTGSRHNTGGLIGRAEQCTQIIECSSTTQVKGNDDTGGLVGMMREGRISKSYVTANIEGSNYVGGLVGGLRWGNRTVCGYVNEIKDCYVTGSISSWGGGLIGHIYWNGGRGSIINCYAAVRMPEGGGGLIGTGFSNPEVTSSYWDKTLSGVTTTWHNLGIGKTTEEMKQKSTYQGWDFDNVWYIDEGVDYPHLKWELER